MGVTMELVMPAEGVLLVRLTPTVNVLVPVTVTAKVPLMGWLKAPPVTPDIVTV